MNRATHLLFAGFIYLGLLQLNILKLSLIGILILILSTLIPDIDSSTSTLGKKTKVFSILFKHRGFFHSLLFFCLIYLLLFFPMKTGYIEFSIGYLSHIFMDFFNYKGVYFFWPLGLKIKGFMKTNSLTEKLIRYFLLFTDGFLIFSLLF